MSGVNDSLPTLISLSIRILNLANLLKQEAVSAQLAHDIQFRGRARRVSGSFMSEQEHWRNT